MKKYVIIFTLLFSATFLFAETITVTSGADSGAGTLRQTILDANDGDVIVFADNVTTIDFAGIINIDKNITISGNETNNTIFQNAITWTDNVNLKRYFEISENVEVIFNNLTLKDNIANCGAGAIANRGKLILNNSTFSNNRAGNGGSGGAILNASIGVLIVDNCNFINNYTHSAGGAICSTGEVSITNSSFTENYASGTGGAIHCSVGTSITNSRFAENYSGNSGGAIYINSAVTASISNCTFEENTAQYGGAISNWGTVSIDKSTFKKNNSSSNGGAISNNSFTTKAQITIINSIFVENRNERAVFQNNGDATIINCLFYKNIVNTNNGIILNEGYAHNPATLALINSTIADNTGFGLYNSNTSGFNRVGYATLRNNIFSNNFYDDVYAENVLETNIIASNNLIGTSNTDLSGNNNIIGENPLFFDVENNDYSLQEESPAIDKGNNDYLSSAEITKDLADNPRISNSTVDMGAYEFQQIPTLVKNTWNEQVNVYAQNRSIIIENTTKPVQVYDMLGKLIASGAGAGSYAVPQIGVYVVKTGGMVKKVIVNN